ncbi:MAG: hypothetical protein R2827_04995 [Bdellovibrionales bacterium]
MFYCPHFLTPFLLIGCESGNKTLLRVRPDAIPASPSYAEYIAPMMEFHCGGCHTGDRAGDDAEDPVRPFPEKVNQTTCCVSSEIEDIIYKSFIRVDMPPG